MLLRARKRRALRARLLEMEAANVSTEGMSSKRVKCKSRPACSPQCRRDTYPESPRMMTFSSTFFLEVILQAGREESAREQEGNTQGAHPPGHRTSRSPKSTAPEPFRRLLPATQGLRQNTASVLELWTQELGHPAPGRSLKE